jgi:hypothetical protein
MAAEERLREEDPMNKQTQADFRTASPFKTRYDNFIGGKFVPRSAGATWTTSPRSPAW